VPPQVGFQLVVINGPSGFVAVKAHRTASVQSKSPAVLGAAAPGLQRTSR